MKTTKITCRLIQISIFVKYRAEKKQGKRKKEKEKRRKEKKKEKRHAGETRLVGPNLNKFKRLVGPHVDIECLTTGWTKS